METTRNIFEEINSICDEFMERWKAGQRPQIEVCLQKIQEDARPTLIRNLLQIEILARRRMKEQPRSAEYFERFPEYTQVIRQSFFESTIDHSTVRRTPSAFHDSVRKTIDFHIPAATRLGSYTLVRELGRGGFGVVYEAIHAEYGDRVALKTLPLSNDLHSVESAKRLHDFRNEYRALADISHPNLVGLNNLEVDGCQWFFTMDLIEGVDFCSFVRPNGKLNETRLRSSLSQLVTGVMALHSQQIVHRDLKPSNVMTTNSGQVVILDFGLVLEIQLDATEKFSQHFRGTAAYAAPEQMAGYTSFASDWYSVGVMLYEALTGSLPFERLSIPKLMLAKQEQEPPPIPQSLGIPDDLAQLAMRLLARDPMERPDIFQIARIAIQKDASISLPPQLGTHRLIGRSDQLRGLEDCFKSVVRNNTPLTAWVQGRSGEGKSSLVEQFLKSPAVSDSILFSGRCYDRESVPFKALDPLIDSLCNYIEELPDTEAALLLPDDIGLLAQVFPVINRIEVVTRAIRPRSTILDEQQVRMRAFGALRTLLSRIGESQPIVLFIDDLQWGDADSALALFEVLRPPDSPNILLIGSYRSDEQTESRFLQEWKTWQHREMVTLPHVDIHVGPLSLQECTELLVAHIGADSEVVRQKAVDFLLETGGNPYFLAELMDCFDPDDSSFEAMPLAEVIRQKLSQLPEASRELLDVIAVSGQAWPLPEVMEAAGGANGAVGTMTHMRRVKLIRMHESADRKVDTYHDKIRETVLGQLDADQKSALHIRIAQEIESAIGVDAELSFAEEVSSNQLPESNRYYDLSYHYDAGGNQPRACRYALVAAKLAKDAFALEVAAEQFRIAERNATAESKSLRYSIVEGLADVLLLAGKYEEAELQFESLMQLASDPLEKAKVYQLQGDLAHKRGEMTQSVVLFEKALRIANKFVPRSRFATFLALAKETAVQLIHTIFPKSILKAEPAGEPQNLTCGLLDRLSMSAWYVFTPKMLWAHLAAMNQAEKYGPSRQLIFSYGLHAAPVSVLGMFTRGFKYGQRAIEMSEEMNDLWGKGHTYNFRAMGLCGGARYEESLADADKAIELLARTGDHWELAVARFHKSLNHHYLGNQSDAIDAAKELFEQSLKLGDDGMAHVGILGWTRATNGEIPFDELVSCFKPLPDNTMCTSMVLQAEGMWHLKKDRLDQSIRCFEESWSIARRDFVINLYTVPSVVWLATALRKKAEGESDKQKSRLLRRAKRMARLSLWLCLFFPQDKPHAERELKMIRKALRQA